MTFDNNEMDDGDYTVIFKNVMEDKKSVYIPSWTCYNTNLNIGKG
jgi:hypothetical protein